MGTYIWRAGSAAPVEIQVNLDKQGLGWFSASSVTPSGGQTDLRRLDADDADGDALFRATPADDLLVSLLVMCANPDKVKSNVWLRVLQNSLILSCTDATGAVINQSKIGGQFEAISLGEIVCGQSLAASFQVWA